MEVSTDQLSRLSVADLMHRSVVSVSAQVELAHAAAVMVENEISCLPVVDEHGKCVGVLTAHDFVTRFSERNASPRPLAGEDVALTHCGPLGSLLLEETPQDYVSPRMSNAVQTIADDAPVLLAARSMCAARLHHLVILDNTSRPVGIISATDILHAVIGDVAGAEHGGHGPTTPFLREAK
jgi:CBS-domain-containing membrane protein